MASGQCPVVGGQALSVKRSGDVTAAAVVMFFGSGLLLLLGAFMIFGAMIGPAANAAQGRQLQLAGVAMAAGMYVALAAWGIATGVGLIKLQPWARISAIVMSALAIAGCAMSATGIFVAQNLFKADKQLPANFASLMLIITLSMLVIPLGIAIWWLILFTRKRVAREFATRGAVAEFGGGAVAGCVEQGSAYGGHAGEFAGGPSAQGAPVTPAANYGRRQIPMSIRVVAVIYILGSVMIFVTVGYMRQTSMPTLLLGKLVEGPSAWAFFIVLGLAQLAICIAALRRRAWAVDGLIAILVFGVANCFGFAFSPAREQLFARTLASQNLPPGVAAETMSQFMHTILPSSLVFGAIVAFALLYLVVTRRKAFREACATEP